MITLLLSSLHAYIYHAITILAAIILYLADASWIRHILRPHILLPHILIMPWYYIDINIAINIAIIYYYLLFAAFIEKYQYWLITLMPLLDITTCLLIFDYYIYADSLDTPLLIHCLHYITFTPLRFYWLLIDYYIDYELMPYCRHWFSDTPHITDYIDSCCAAARCQRVFRLYMPPFISFRQPPQKALATDSISFAEYIWLTMIYWYLYYTPCHIFHYAFCFTLFITPLPLMLITPLRCHWCRDITRLMPRHYYYYADVPIFRHAITLMMPFI